MREQMNKVKNFGQFLNENTKDYNDVMTKCVQYNSLRDKYDGEYEEYVRCKIQSFVDSADYFEAKNQVYKYYKEARLNNQGDFDKEFDVVLMGYENIMRDISKIDRGVDIGREFSKKCDDINEIDVIDKYKKAIEYESFIIKTGNETSKVIGDDIDALLKQNKAEKALDVLNNFYKSSFDGRFSCFIEHDMLKARILSFLKKA